MTWFKVLCASLCAMALAVVATQVQAQTVYYVAAPFYGGSDNNNCSYSSPCATFAHAIEQGGAAEIDCLSSGYYGALNNSTVSITGSITIDCGEGNVGRVAANGGAFAAININTGSAATIVLRHLNLNGFGASNISGISTQNFPSGTLVIEHCQIHGFNTGIAFVPSSGRGILEVSDTTVYDNGYGIYINALASNVIASAVLDGIKLNGNSPNGLVFAGPGVIAGTLRQSVVAENNGDGIYSSAGQVYFTVEESSIIDNLDNGVETESAGTSLNVGASTIGGNGTGLFAGHGSIFTFGNNQMSANGSNGSFTSGGPGLQ